MQNHPLLSIVIPVFNEEAVLHETAKRLLAVLQKVDSWELIFVDDASTDGSLKMIQEMRRQDQRIKWLHLETNSGQQAAFEQGMAAARGQAIITMDADLQDPPELIPDMLLRWSQGAKLVQTQRRSRSNTWPRSILYDFYYTFVNLLSGKRVLEKSGDFCLYDRVVLEKLLKAPVPQKMFRFLRASLKIENSAILKFDEAPRYAGDSKYSWSKLFHLAFLGLENLGALNRVMLIFFFLAFALQVALPERFVAISLPFWIFAGVLLAFRTRFLWDPRSSPIPPQVSSRELE